ncbi:hypothetical protein GEMRC1_012597 [Eukaryota sp. GEM-RC1]
MSFGVEFVFIGSGPQSNFLRKSLRHHVNNDHVTFLGSLNHSEVLSYLQKSHIFLNCSRTEAFGLSILEALSCGNLIVSTNVGGIPELFQQISNIQDCTHFLAPPLSGHLCTSLESAIKKVIDGESNQHCHSDIFKIFDWSLVSAQTETVYTNVLDNWNCKKFKSWRFLRASVVLVFLFIVNLLFFYCK